MKKIKIFMINKDKNNQKKLVYIYITIDFGK